MSQDSSILNSVIWEFNQLILWGTRALLTLIPLLVRLCILSMLIVASTLLLEIMMLTLGLTWSHKDSEKNSSLSLAIARTRSKNFQSIDGPPGQLPKPGTIRMQRRNLTRKMIMQWMHFVMEWHLGR